MSYPEFGPSAGVAGPGTATLRRLGLAVSLTSGLPVQPSATGLMLLGQHSVAPKPGARIPDVITWTELAVAIAGADIESNVARERVIRWVATRIWLLGLTVNTLADRIRPLGLPADHTSHPGIGWSVVTVPGGLIDQGVAAVDLDPTHPDALVPLPFTLLRFSGHGTTGWFPTAAAYLEKRAEYAAARYRLHPQAPLRPAGDCDVVTLLTSRTMRMGLLADIPSGLRAIALPERDRGWLDVRAIDPAFVATAAAMTEPEKRGFDHLLLVSVHEVAAPKPGGDLLSLLLRDPPPNEH